MIDLTKAIELAKKSAMEVLQLQALSVEEVERSSYNGRDVWSITLSFPRDLEKLSPIASLVSSAFDYKRFLLDADTGEFVAMKLREPVPR